MRFGSQAKNALGCVFSKISGFRFDFERFCLACLFNSNLGLVFGVWAFGFA